MVNWLGRNIESDAVKYLWQYTNLHLYQNVDERHIVAFINRISKATNYHANNTMADHYRDSRRECNGNYFQWRHISALKYRINI